MQPQSRTCGEQCRTGDAETDAENIILEYPKVAGGKGFAQTLGFTRRTTPCCTTLHYLFATLDHAAFEEAVARWTLATAEVHGWTTVSLDGKTLRGSTDVQLPGVHLLAAYAHEAGMVLRQLPDDARTNEHNRSTPTVLSTLRNSVPNVLSQMGVRNRAAQLRTFCVHPVKALAAIHSRKREN